MPSGLRFRPCRSSLLVTEKQPMPEVVCTTLAEHLARYGPGPAGLVFTNTFGRPLRRNTVGDMWHRAALQASCYRRDYLRTTVGMPARIFGDDFSLGE
jgi:hypothetical protein